MQIHYGNNLTLSLPAPSTPPQDLRQVVISATWVTLNWLPPPEENWNGLIRHYLVFAIESDTGRSFTLNSTTSNYRVENLHPFYTYNFSVAAVTVETGPRSSSITLQTAEAIPSGPPRNLVAANVTSDSISLAWDPPTAANQNGIIHTYNINVTVLENGDNIQLTANNTELFLDMLHPYYTYNFIISAVTIGPGPPSSVYTITTEEEGNVTLFVWQKNKYELQTSYSKMHGKLRLHDTVLCTSILFCFVLWGTVMQ